MPLPNKRHEHTFPVQVNKENRNTNERAEGTIEMNCTCITALGFKSDSLS